jgi:hypothetical protein
MSGESGIAAADSNRAVSLPTIVRLERIALIGLLLGGLATWPLWTGGQSFPQIPWVGWAARVPQFVDKLLLAACGVAAIATLVTTHRLSTLARVAFSAAAVGLVLLDQHRLQPWVLHLLCVLWLIWLAPNERGLPLVRAFVISIYVHSALSRFDRASLEQQWELLAPMLERVGVTTRFASESQRLSAGAAFTLWELAVALLLAFPCTRRLGVWGSIVMHAGLILILGPLGQDHHPGVLIWNVTWIVQNIVLFGRGSCVDSCETASVVEDSTAWRGRIATALAGVVIFAPLLEPWGWWDHWPSWRVYSARPETVAFYVAASRVADLPSNVQKFVGSPEPLSDWRPVNLDAWSFDELRCPVYPQERFRLAVALAITRERALGDDVRVVVSSPPDRWNGERAMRELHGERALVAACERFVVNTKPRSER